MASDSEHEDDSKSSDQSIPLRPAPSSAQNQGTTITGNVVLPCFFRTDAALLNATNVVRDYRNGVDTNRPHDPRTAAEIATLQTHIGIRMPANLSMLAKFRLVWGVGNG
ncbi:hypothetical protein LTR75_008588 [Friedmanniomyces endolithicus]|nr:hypothetical protein LTR75_008588 [Friedmanniomyces endolithicus]